MINTKLFLHNFYKNRVTLLIYLLILTLPSLTIALNTIMPSSGTESWYISDISLIIFVAFCYIGTWHFTFSNFSFMSKRSADDIYSSIPISRQKLYFTQFLSSVAMTGAVLFVSYFINFFISAISFISSSYYPSAFLLDAFLVILFVAVCSLVGISLSGTAISAFVSSVLVGLTPYALVLFFSANFTLLDPSVNFSYIEIVSILFENPALAPISLLIYPVSGYYIPGFDTSLTTIFTTLLICAVYALIGLLLFKKRPSEVSGNMNLGSKNRAFFRILITLPALLIIAEIIMLNIAYSTPLEITIIITIFVIAVCLYFGYELIATKSFKETTKSAPLFLISVAFVGALTALIPVAAEVSKSTIPQSEDVLSIQLVYNGDGYFENLAGDVVHTDPEIIAHVMSAFNYTNSMHGYDTFSFKITTKNLETQIRNITLPSNGASFFLETFFELVEENEEHQRTMATLPEEATNLYIYSYSVRDIMATDKQILEVYDALKQDFENGVKLSYNSRPTFVLHFVDAKSGRYGEVQISDETPLALEKILEIYNKTNSFDNLSIHSSSLFVQSVAFNDGSEKEGNYLSYNYTNYLYEDLSQYEIYYEVSDYNKDELSGETREELFAVLEEAQHTTLDDNPVSFGTVSDSLNTYLFLFTEEQILEIKEILE